MDMTNSAGAAMAASATEKPRAVGSADAVLAVLTAAAEVGAPCPSNLDLSHMLGASTRGAGGGVIRRLLDRGLIRVDGRGTSRVITIVASGKSTGVTALKASRVTSGKARPWTADEIAIVEREVRAGKSDSEIGALLGRNANSVWCRANPVRRDLREDAPPVAEPPAAAQAMCHYCGSRIAPDVTISCRACKPLRSAGA
jgi:hypothetical protein